jgi:outer membrane protein assembly factor BamD (BamD/ComL family)
MNTLKKLVGLVIAVTFLVACQSSKSKLSERIVVLEKETSTEFDVKKLDNLLSLYHQYINEFPQDATIEEYLFKAGTLSMSLRKGGDALSDFAMLISRFPQSVYLAEVYYYKAFVYEDIIYDIDAAKIAYNDFIARFPDHKSVSDAKLSVQYLELGMSTEEIVASFEEKKE